MTVRDETHAALRTFSGNAVLTVVDGAGYPVSIRCRPEPAADPVALEITRPGWLTIGPGRACLMAHSHDEDMWNLRGILAKGAVAVDGDRLRFIPETFRWLADTGGGTFSVFRRAAGAVLQTRRDAAAYLRRTGQQGREVPWQTIVDAVGGPRRPVSIADGVRTGLPATQTSQRVAVAAPSSALSRSRLDWRCAITDG